MSPRRVLVSGAGIAGTSVAYWLQAYGCNVTVVERSKSLRLGGQAVDFKGETHRQVLRAMSVLEDVEQRQTGKTDLLVVDEHDHQQAVIPGEFVGGDLEILRGDLGELLYSRTASSCDYVFGDSLTSIEDTGSAVRVTFEKSSPRTVDLVIGADGIHSRVRELAFGPEREFVEHLGYYYAVAGATVGSSGSAATRPERSVGYMYNVPGRLAVLGGSKAPEMYVFASPPLDIDRSDVSAQKALLREQYRGLAWRVPAMLDRLDDVDDFFLDAIARVQLSSFTKGRVALVGDSAYGNTLGGFGTGLAMVGAYVLAGELQVADQNHRAAFARYDSVMHEYAKIARKGNAGPFLAPLTPSKIRMRNWTFTNPLTYRLMMKLTERYARGPELKDYVTLKAPR